VVYSLQNLLVVQEGILPNAIEMLRKDHDNLKKLFEEFEDAEDSQTKQQIVELLSANWKTTAFWKKRSSILPLRNTSMTRH